MDMYIYLGGGEKTLFGGGWQKRGLWGVFFRGYTPQNTHRFTLFPLPSPPPLLPPPPPPAPIAFLVTTYQNSRENRNKFTTIHAGKNKATEPIQR